MIPLFKYTGLLFAFFAFFPVPELVAQATGKFMYQNKNAPLESRVNDLLQKMTLREKVLQLNQYTLGENTNVNNVEKEAVSLDPGIGSLIYFMADPVLRNQVQKKAMEETRLGIPILFGFDVIHGYRTIYPISLAQACSWNPSLVTTACSMAAKEAKLSGLNWTFSPMIDVSRDPRWGRISECYGEDPFTNAVFGVATVKGYQGSKLSDPYSIAACLKHYVGYGMSEGGRDYHSSNISAQSLWETYMVPYEACIKAGAATVMSAFNDINGVPASANYYLLTTILKQQWKHAGFVVSDWDAVDQLIPQGFAKDRKEGCYKAFMAGVEMGMHDKVYFENMEQLVAEKKIAISKIDEAVTRVLLLKFKLGLFDAPYTTVVPESIRYLQPASLEIAGKLAAESIVLLKNNNGVLPISSGVKNIAVIGPIARDTVHILGSWFANGLAKDATSIINGLSAEFTTAKNIQYARGCDFDGTDDTGFAEAVSLAMRSDVVIICMGEKREWSGENASRSTIALPAIQERLVQEIKKTGKPVILVLSNGRPLELVRLEPLADAIVEIWQPGTMTGQAVAGILSGRTNPSAKLSVTFPLTTGQIPTYYNMRQSARPTSGIYQELSNEPLYWFGHGLSYTTFKYAAIQLSAKKINKKQRLIASIEVTNTGKVTGKETVHWFISDPSASITRPLKELKHFEKQELTQGQKAVFKFEIDPMRDLSFPGPDGKRRLESGTFHILVNNQKVTFELLD